MAGEGELVTLRHLDHPDWVVQFVFGPQGPASVIIRPHVEASNLDDVVAWWGQAAVTSIPSDSRPVTARLLRQLPIGELESWARGRLRAEAEGPTAPWFPHLRDWFGDDHRRDGKRGPSLPDAAFAALAAAYVTNLTQGGSVRDLASAQGWSEKTIRNRLTEARRRGMLTSAPAGRAGGDLTEKARQTLKEADQ